MTPTFAKYFVMPFEKPLTVSVGQLSDLVAKTVGSLDLRLNPDTDFVGLDFYRNPLVVGLVIRDLSPLFGASVETLTKAADQIADGAGVPTILIREGGITIGYYPQVEIPALEMQR